MSAVGFIGLGNIGAPMASHLIDWPDGLVVCDVRADATAPFIERGARAVTTAGEVAEVADVISVMVLDDDQVRAVVHGTDGILSRARAGSVVAIHSTIAPGTAEMLAAEAAAAGIDIVDAPVSGGFMGAHEGNLAVMVGGTADALEQCRPVFARWAGLIAHLGPVGAGTRAKLARNLIQFAAFVAVGEAQRLAEAAGVDLVELAKVVRHSDAVTGGPGAVMLRSTSAPLASDDPLFPVLDHTRQLGEKDLRLALELAAELDVDLPVATLALDELATALGIPRPDATESQR